MTQAPAAIRVLLVASDPALRRALADALGAPHFALVATVARSAEATGACERLAPDVIVVDGALGDEGSATIQDIMAFRPRPILALVDPGSPDGGLQALSLGALDVLARTADGSAPQALDSRLRLLAGVRVITHVKGRQNRRRQRLPAPPGAPVVGIVASLGGPRALAAMLGALPRDLPAPVCIVQHISEGFSEGLAAWLSTESGFAVREAVDGEPLAPGVALVAPTGVHLTVDGSAHVVLDRSAPVGGFRPSATVLLRSLAQHLGPRGIGVVLTGMGSDGAEGLAALKAAGGRTLAQAEESCVVYGMPRAAVQAGAVEQVLPLEELAPAVASLVRRAQTARGVAS